MLDDALKSVRDAEQKAADVLREAEEKAGAIVEEAKEKARSMKSETEKQIRAQKQNAEDSFLQDSESQLADAEAQALKEVDALRQFIEPKRADAVKAVIESLV